MTRYADLLIAAQEAVDLAAEIVRRMRPGMLTSKGDRDMATEVDFAVERRVRAFLSDRTPDVAFLGEEEGVRGATGGLMWALDPLDGTVNFIHGSPLCAVSLGLVDERRSVIGVIDLPFLDARYWAAEDCGAHANGRPIRVSSTTDIGEAVVAIGDYAVGHDAERRNRLRFAVTRQLAAEAQRLRMHGSAAIDLAWLASGKVDAVVMMSNKPWDTAAGVAIAREAGASVVDRDGSPHTYEAGATIAANPALLPRILACTASGA